MQKCLQISRRAAGSTDFSSASARFPRPLSLWRHTDCCTNTEIEVESSRAFATPFSLSGPANRCTTPCHSSCARSLFSEPMPRLTSHAVHEVGQYSRLVGRHPCILEKLLVTQTDRCSGAAKTAVVAARGDDAKRQADPTEGWKVVGKRNQTTETRAQSWTEVGRKKRRSM